ncbi:Crp/Fnr family transcriptional regulator [Mycobacterium sp. ITM-2016-00317]|uniref:Crp/Fnr family transcriptional regulator n=1 Tax=Mycobacterium sp. ITM-2016-00317 TaxID=2099694 RepID=UPI00287F5FFF|nr:Crp/Fnr family transcriptional regulator [Mycobacterium sp. ITM-2016-00317]WNG85907.1 Crp/Fnr family transcriptional regulator [Mycobacterium sp. ITM-2016-00317]
MDLAERHFRLESLFPGLSLPDLLAAEDVSTLDVGAGEVIYTAGDPGTCLFLLGYGRVQLGRSGYDGRECTFTVLGPGELFGEESVFDPGRRGSTATALTDACALSLGRRTVMSMLATDPRIAQGFLRVLARRIRRTDSNITDAVYADVAARVAKQLLGLAQRFGVQEDGAMRVPMDLTQQQFAHLVGTSRESVNKALCHFAQQGWIVLGADSIVIRESEPLAVRMNGSRRPGRGTDRVSSTDR